MRLRSATTSLLLMLLLATFHPGSPRDLSHPPAAPEAGAATTAVAAKVVTYHVETRGRLRANVGVFKRQAQATYDHDRGWRRAGIRFRQVARGGSFTLVLAEASWLPRFSSGCSRDWSCRVGRYVVINETRWRQATPLWRRHGGTIRGYRHLVVNHETGHWLGLGHRGCPRRGARAPVMQPQSKGLDGCRINPFPRPGELAAAR